MKVVVKSSNGRLFPDIKEDDLEPKDYNKDSSTSLSFATFLICKLRA